MTRTRIDRFIEDALVDFRDWFRDSDWRGKEHDCVNLFALGFLAPAVRPDAAIRDLRQIRIESAVRQPEGYPNRSARKDLVIWRDGLTTAWAEDWSPQNDPWVVMEWKCKNRGRPTARFNDHDLEWLTRFTDESPASLGYLVRVYNGPQGRSLRWSKVRKGTPSGTDLRS